MRWQRMARIISMLLSYIIHELDAELDRLRRLREIVASLETAFVLQPLPSRQSSEQPLPQTKPEALPSPALFLQRPEAESQAAPSSMELAPAPEPTPRKPFRARRMRKARPVRPSEVKSASAPAPPKIVVVSAEQLQRERATRGTLRQGGSNASSASTGEASPAREAEPAPESLARTLAARWLGDAGPSASAN